MSTLIDKIRKNAEISLFMDSLYTRANHFRFVGGIVRDLLLGKDIEEIKDIDIATDLLPEETIELMQEIGIKAIPTGLKYGTVTCIYKHYRFEITTLRKEIYDYQNRKPLVKFTKSWQKDAKRRDFTINALYLDFKGELYDYFSGFVDLNANIVRFIGDTDERIIEDPLRIMRYFRILGYIYSLKGHDKLIQDKIALDKIYSKSVDDIVINLNLHDLSVRACYRNQDKLIGVSTERIKDEFWKILAFENIAILCCVLLLMKHLHILSFILPIEINLDNLILINDLYYKSLQHSELSSDSKSDDSLNHRNLLGNIDYIDNSDVYDADNIKDIVNCTSNPVMIQDAFTSLWQEVKIITRLVLVIKDDKLLQDKNSKILEKQTQKLCDRLNLSKREKKELSCLLVLTIGIQNITELKDIVYFCSMNHIYSINKLQIYLNKLKIYLADFNRETFKQILILTFFELLSTDKFKSEDCNIVNNFVSLLNQIDKISIPEFPLNGRYLLKLGFKPGEQIGNILNHYKMIWQEQGCNLNTEELVLQIKKDYKL